MVDYARLEKTSDRLISKNGRLVQFGSYNRAPQDPTKPWKGNAAGGDFLTLPAVFAPPNTVRQFGLTALGQGFEITDMFKNCELIGIVCPRRNDLSNYDHVIDDGQEWNIVALQVLKPANIPLVAYVGVRR